MSTESPAAFRSGAMCCSCDTDYFDRRRRDLSPERKPLFL
jgi:hypothetical protein